MATDIFTHRDNHNAQHSNLVCTWFNNELINIFHEIHLIKFIRSISSISSIFVAYHHHVIISVPP